MIKQAKKLKITRAVILGDLTEEKDRHPAILVNKVVDHVYSLAQICPVVIVLGNHDYKEEGRAFFQFLRRIPNTRFIRKPVVIGDELFLPHTGRYKRDWADIDMAKYRTIFCHQTFNGADVGFGRQIDGIPRDVLPKRSTVFTGDIHVPQEDRNLVYVGAPYHVDFGDNFASRLVYRDNPNSWVSLDTSSLPQKRSFSLTTSDDDLRHQFFNVGDICQIKVDVDDMGGWLPLRDRLKADAEKRGLRVWSIKPKLIARAVRRQHEVKDRGSDRDLLATFAKRQGLTENTLKAGYKLL